MTSPVEAAAFLGLDGQVHHRLAPRRYPLRYERWPRDHERAAARGRRRVTAALARGAGPEVARASGAERGARAAHRTSVGSSRDPGVARRRAVASFPASADRNAMKLGFRGSDVIAGPGRTAARGSSYLVGLILVALGVLALVFADALTVASIIAFGVLLVLGGLAELVHAIRAKERDRSFLAFVSGLLSIAGRRDRLGRAGRGLALRRRVVPWTHRHPGSIPLLGLGPLLRDPLDGARRLGDAAFAHLGDVAPRHRDRGRADGARDRGDGRVGGAPATRGLLGDPSLTRASATATPLAREAVARALAPPGVERPGA